MQLHKEQRKDNKLKNQLNLPENALEAVKPYFGPQNMFDGTFVEHRQCIMWPLISENKQQLDKKEKNAKLIINCFFFEKKFISKDIKAINYKLINLNRFVHSSKGSPWDLQLSGICLTNTKRTSNMTKNKNSFSFFCEKPVWKPVSSKRTL